ncbi:hypothetical protein M970_040990 [Encephalitozoon cuniculi EcunIII-L]|nr:hypothetical protein M970_040990 [Encephalitozoon cuniculi EcunIII-L]UYI27486.1 putative DNA-directed RNA polymerase I subunit [Encephalitozoon cuniculi]
MLVLANINREMSFEVSRVNGRVFLTGSLDGIEYRGSEWNSPCSYYVVESSGDVLDFGKASEAKIVVFETVYETGLSHKETNLEELIFSFGNRKYVEYLKRKEIDGYSKRLFMPKLKYKNQILPPIDEEASSPEKRFVLEKMFPADVLESFSKIKLDSVLLHPDLMGLRQNMRYKTHFLLADCIIKLMEKKYVTNDCLSDSGYSSFFVMVKDEVENGRLTPLCRDRLAVLCYILFLQIEGFCVKYKLLPDFKFSKKKVVNIFNLMGFPYHLKTDVFKPTERAVCRSDIENQVHSMG